MLLLADIHTLLIAGKKKESYVVTTHIVCVCVCVCVWVGGCVGECVGVGVFVGAILMISINRFC